MAKKKKNKSRSRNLKKKNKVSKNKKSNKARSKSKSRAKVPVVTEEKLADLVRRVRGRGFVTESEIIQTFPSIEEDISGLESLYRKLEELSIKIISAQERLGGDKNLTDKERLKKTESLIGLGPTYDSVQIYLREIGKISLNAYNF